MNASWTRLLPAFIRQRIEGHFALQQVLSNTSWLGLGKVLRLGVSLFVTAWVARYLGPEQFGLFSYAIAMVALLGAFAALGLEGILVRDLVREPGAASTLLGTAFVLRLGGGLLVFLLSFGLAFLIRPGDAGLGVLVAVIALGSVFQAFDVIDTWFQSQLLSKYTVLAKSMAFLLVAIVKILLIIVEAPLIAFAWAATAEVALGAGALLLAYRYTEKSLVAWRLRLDMVRRLLKESWPLILSGLSIALYMRIDQIMLGKMVGDHAVGIYSAAIHLSELSYIFPVIIVASAAPALYRLHKTDEARFNHRLQQLFRLLVALALVIAIPASLLADVIVGALYGSAYAESGSVLAVHVWTAVFVYLGVAQGPWYFSNNLVKLSAIYTVAGAAANIVLNYWLIPSYGVVGAAMATLLSQALASVLMNGIAGKTRALFFMQLRAFQVWK